MTGQGDRLIRWAGEVEAALGEHGSLTTPELIKLTGLSERAVSRGLAYLLGAAKAYDEIEVRPLPQAAVNVWRLVHG